MNDGWRLEWLGDAALSVHAVESSALAANACVHRLARRLRAAGVAGVRDVVPGMRELVVHVDPLRCDVRQVALALQATDADRDVSRRRTRGGRARRLWRRSSVRTWMTSHSPAASIRRKCASAMRPSSMSSVSSGSSLDFPTSGRSTRACACLDEPRHARRCHQGRWPLPASTRASIPGRAPEGGTSSGTPTCPCSISTRRHRPG